MTFDEWWREHGSGLPPMAEEDAHEHVHRVSALCWQAAQSDSSLSAGLGSLPERLRACAEDPMWADHAEVPKALIADAANAIEEACDIAGHFMAQRDEARQLLKKQREQMIADGWRQTAYAAPVTDCEACLTPDACSLRGQCGHYLREQRDDDGPHHCPRTRG